MRGGSMRKVQKQEKKAREREASQYVTMERAAEQGKETHIVPKIQRPVLSVGYLVCK